MQCLRYYIENGWPDKKYWSFRDELTCVDGILYKGLKVIISRQLRKEMLGIAHSTHLGIVSCKKRAREFMFWVGMMGEIQDRVEKCEICAKNNKKANHEEPMISSEIPDRPSSKLGTDLFVQNDNHYLLTVDYYSKGPEVEKVDNLSSSNVIAYLKKQFSRHGYIDELVTDLNCLVPNSRNSRKNISSLIQLRVLIIVKVWARKTCTDSKTTDQKESGPK